MDVSKVKKSTVEATEGASIDQEKDIKETHNLSIKDINIERLDELIIQVKLKKNKILANL